MKPAIFQPTNYKHRRWDGENLSASARYPTRAAAHIVETLIAELSNVVLKEEREKIKS